jgi:hypothetical protein
MNQMNVFVDVGLQRKNRVIEQGYSVPMLRPNEI